MADWAPRTDENERKAKRAVNTQRTESSPLTEGLRTSSATTCHLLLIPFFLIMLSGCGIRLFSNPDAQISAHTVQFVEPGCSVFVAQTLREGLSLVRITDAGYTPSQGDIFEGPPRVGPSVFRVFNGTESKLREGGRSVQMEIVAKNLQPSGARRQLQEACSGS